MAAAGKESLPYACDEPFATLSMDSFAFGLPHTQLPGSRLVA
jgi:hypothetical protein